MFKNALSLQPTTGLSVMSHSFFVETYVGRDMSASVGESLPLRNKGYKK